MFPDANLPLLLMTVLAPLASCFTAPTFRTFCGLVAGLTGQVRRRTVAGMLLGACLAWPHDRAHRLCTTPMPSMSPPSRPPP
jgi:hypothetical protein